MPDLPTGAVTFLFTDIEGSTARWERHPMAMLAALERHNALLRAAIEARSGRVFKTMGDAFCAAFSDARRALEAALDAQRALAAENWSAFGTGFPPLAVRMALHTGEAEKRAGDYYGPPLNRVARLETAGHGGQILLSARTCDLVHDALPPGVRLRDLGTHRLRDLRHAEHIYQAVCSDLPVVTRALRTAGHLEARHRILVEANGSTLTPLAPGIPPDDAVAEAQAELLAVVRSDDRSVVLSENQARALAAHRPADLDAYRLGRIAEWSLPRFRLHGRYVEVALLVDRDAGETDGQWRTQDAGFVGLRALMTGLPDPALVVLGPPGSGKSTLLRRLEMSLAMDALKSEGADHPVTFFVQLNHYAPLCPGQEHPAPEEWLAARWAARFPDLPPLDALLAEGRVILLLDALNEIPVTDGYDYHSHVDRWRRFIHRVARDAPGNRFVFTCRTHDYSAPLSAPDLRVPQARIAPLSDEQVRQFLKLNTPLHWRETWTSLKGTPHLEALCLPYFLRLFVDLVEAEGRVTGGRTSLFTGIIRHALRREVERGNPLYEPGQLMTTRDCRRIARWLWRSDWDLPDRGPLIPKLAALAHGLQVRQGCGGPSQVRVSYDDALAMLDHERAADIVRAGTQLGVLDEDPASDEIMFIHQLAQDFFAARRLAEAPDPDPVRAPWRADDVSPALADTVATLAPADPLPPLATTGWEETTIMAASMARDPGAFVRSVAEANLVVAGQCAAQHELDGRLPSELIRELRTRLVARSRDPAADLRARIAAGLMLGALGDPRFERQSGPHGDYLLPPLVELAGGTYPIGSDEGHADEAPVHSTKVAPFAIGRFPVTNAEWTLFMAGGGYGDERWWDTEAALAWQQGEGTTAGIRFGVRYWLESFRADPALLDRLHESGQQSSESHERWRRRLEMSEDELAAHLAELYPGGRESEPMFWRDEAYRNPAQPVVGVSWFEARAYCAWLAAQTGLPFRLPAEAEWEAAARGTEGRRYAYGDAFDPLCGNTVETHVRRPTPVGVFPAGDTPEGVADLTGNTWDWTSSLYGRSYDQPEFAYPYRADDGREDDRAGAEIIRVARGGGWYGDGEIARASYRLSNHPDHRAYNDGFRLAASLPLPD